MEAAEDVDAEPRAKRRRTASPSISAPSQTGRKRANICSCCKKRFPSGPAWDYHNKIKLLALSKRRIEVQEYRPNRQRLVCQFDQCCFSTKAVEDMVAHLTSGRHGSKRQLLKNGTISFFEGKPVPAAVYVIEVMEGAEDSATTCPSCQQHFGNGQNLKKHVKSGICPGINFRTEALLSKNVIFVIFANIYRYGGVVVPALCSTMQWQNDPSPSHGFKTSPTPLFKSDGRLSRKTETSEVQK